MKSKNYHKTRLSLQPFEMCIYTDHEIKMVCSRKICTLMPLCMTDQK